MILPAEDLPPDTSHAFEADDLGDPCHKNVRDINGQSVSAYKRRVKKFFKRKFASDIGRFSICGENGILRALTVADLPKAPSSS